MWDGEMERERERERERDHRSEEPDKHTDWRRH